MTVPGMPHKLTSDSTNPTSMAAARMAVSGPRHSQTALYRFFDADENLLYVGISNRLPARWREHSRRYASTWWPLVQANTVDWYLTRTEAARAERHAIQSEKPLHNTLHTPRNRVPRGSRVGAETLSLERGTSLLAVIKEHFEGTPFTASDAIAVSDLGPAAVEKNLRALLGRGELMIVGCRHVVETGKPRRSSSLMALPLLQWIDGDTKQPLPASRIPDVQTSMRFRTPAPPPPEKKQFLVPPQPLAPITKPLPPVVTFTSGAALLVGLGFVDNITGPAIRYISRTDGAWPFGPGKPHPYGKTSNTTTMDTTAFLDFFRAGVRRGGQGRPSISSTASAPGGGR